MTAEVIPTDAKLVDALMRNGKDPAMEAISNCGQGASRGDTGRE